MVSTARVGNGVVVVRIVAAAKAAADLRMWLRGNRVLDGGLVVVDEERMAKGETMIVAAIILGCWIWM